MPALSSLVTTLSVVRGNRNGVQDIEVVFIVLDLCAIQVCEQLTRLDAFRGRGIELMSPAPADLSEQPQQDLIERTQEEWTLGVYPNLGAVFMPIAAQLVDAANVSPNDTVLDVACGTGNVALTASRRGADVTGVDITPAMLKAARERATVIGADVDWQEGDAAALPFQDSFFDVTLSCLGHMFVPDADAAGSELIRVTRPGGRIAYTSWTLGSAIAAMMSVLSEYVPPEPDSKPSPPPVLWGDPETVRDRFRNHIEDISLEAATVMYPALSPAHFWHAMTRDSGGIMLAVEAVPEADRDLLEEAMLVALEPYYSEAENGIVLEYQLVTATVAK
jgi:SAM-dependent methyltransferase